MPNALDLETVQFTARLDPDLHRDLAVLAKNREVSINRALSSAVREYLHVRQTREELEVPDGDGNPPLVQISRRHCNDDGVWTCGVVVEQTLVPYVVVYELPSGSRGGFEDEVGYMIGLDDRFGTSVMTYEEMWKQMWFWAQAMAVAAGFTSHGPNSRRLNRHGPS